ncbi:DUF502 domain-containing protein [Poriferisphaera sp. WC338]|uniref:DUF502 domain-containing protein n=1 Tax=Poriferisphaera sp. WC338 TaxID=3425129 RepID=UPI003D816DB9
MAARKHAKKFFFRGLAIVLPTVLTFWLLWVAYQFIDEKIAEPINSGIQSLIVKSSDWPEARNEDFSSDYFAEHLSAAQNTRITNKRTSFQTSGENLSGTQIDTLMLAWKMEQADIVLLARESAMHAWWNSVNVGPFNVLNLIGLVVALAMIYIVGVILSGYIGRRLYGRGEKVLNRIPLIRRVYPSVKQVTDFFVGEDSDPSAKFNRVVAVEYPRKGLWSVGLVTGSTMRTIQEAAQGVCLTVFIPSSPTPFTGYVITVKEQDTIDLDINIEDALKFAVSLGVLVPPSQDSIKSLQSEHSQEVGSNSGDNPADNDLENHSASPEDDRG